jgi:hypothetical protein
MNGQMVQCRTCQSLNANVGVFTTQDGVTGLIARVPTPGKIYVINGPISG